MRGDVADGDITGFGVSDGGHGGEAAAGEDGFADFGEVGVEKDDGLEAVTGEVAFAAVGLGDDPAGFDGEGKMGDGAGSGGG